MVFLHHKYFSCGVQASRLSYENCHLAEIFSVLTDYISNSFVLFVARQTCPILHASSTSIRSTTTRWCWRGNRPWMTAAVLSLSTSLRSWNRAWRTGFAAAPHGILFISLETVILIMNRAVRRHMKCTFERKMWVTVVHPAQSEHC